MARSTRTCGPLTHRSARPHRRSAARSRRGPRTITTHGWAGYRGLSCVVRTRHLCSSGPRTGRPGGTRSGSSMSMGCVSRMCRCCGGLGSEGKWRVTLRFLYRRGRRRSTGSDLRLAGRRGRSFLRRSFFGFGSLFEFRNDHGGRRDEGHPLFFRSFLAGADRRLDDRAWRADSLFLLLNQRLVLAHDDRARTGRELLPGDDCRDHLRLENLI